MDSVAAKNRIFSIKKLPASPEIVQAVIRIGRNPNVSMSDYEQVISRDPGLAAEFLRVVNSPYYGLSQQVSNLRIALSMLGQRETYRIVANSGFYKVFRSIFKDVDFDLNIFWKHSQTTANAALWLARKHLPNYSSEAYIAGLLHDVGKLVMQQFFNEEYQRLLQLLQDPEADELKMEQQVFGLTHGEIGATLLIRWNIPKEIIIPVRYHHHPAAAPAHEELARIAYFAEKIATVLMSRTDQRRIREFFVEDALWRKMISDYPQFDVLGNEELLVEARRAIFQNAMRDGHGESFSDGDAEVETEPPAAGPQESPTATIDKE